MPEGGDAQVYRPRWVLIAGIGLSAALWLAALVFLSRLGGVPTATLLGAVALLAFFSVAGAYHLRAAILVDTEGLTVRTLTRTLRIGFGEIRGIEVLPGPVTVYSVHTRAGFFHFTSFFKHHRALAALVADRARLAASRW